MVDRKVVPFDEFYYQLKLTHVFQKHPLYRMSTSHYRTAVSTTVKFSFVRFKMMKLIFFPQFLDVGLSLKVN
jgi:hypothetical protein